MSPKKLHLSIDLVEAALEHRQFLQLVDAYPSLYAGPHVQNAVRRYELLWLPLLAQSSVTEDIAAPLDIAWVWHVHMLSPTSYEKDCNEVVSTLVDHKILVGKKLTRGLERARNLWKAAYPSEPFEVDLTASVGHVPDFESRIEYDITAACGRQRVFYYQVSLPHYGDKKFLKRALERYKQHLVLKQQNPDLFFVPCYDFDLIWHAHQVHPLIYQKDTTKILGKVLNHDDSVNDRQPGSKLSRSYETTRRKWKEAGQELALRGAMFRGEPPLSTSIQAELVDYTKLAALQYTVKLTRLEVEGLPKATSYKVKIDVVNGERVLKTRVRGPAISLSNSTNVLSTFKFNTKESNSLRVRDLNNKLRTNKTPNLKDMPVNIRL